MKFPYYPSVALAVSSDVKIERRAQVQLQPPFCPSVEVVRAAAALAHRFNLNDLSTPLLKSCARPRQLVFCLN